MAAPRQETLVRPTDIVADVALSRIGNSGTGLGDDLLSKINQLFGVPVEVTPNSPASTILNVGVGVYTLPNGQRIALYNSAAMSALSAGTVNFATGAISTGAVASFASSLPTMTAGNYVKALIQYEIDSNSLNVTFGSQNAVLASASVPDVNVGFSPVCLVELHSTAGGVGVFDAITGANLVKLVGVGGSSAGGAGPREEVQTVVGSPQTVFNLTTISIPADRKKLTVFTNGVKEVDPTHYSVTTDTQVTFVSARPVNAEVTFRVA